jgi:hypothetical protein
MWERMALAMESTSFILLSCVDCSSTLKKEAIRSSKSVKGEAQTTAALSCPVITVAPHREDVWGPGG